MDAINKQGLRITKILGMNDVKKDRHFRGTGAGIFPCGQRYLRSASDLVYCGRTLFGSKPPKRQELHDHYFGAIKPRVKGIYGGSQQ